MRLVRIALSCMLHCYYLRETLLPLTAELERLQLSKTGETL
jgi:hypothetical protein